MSKVARSSTGPARLDENTATGSHIMPRQTFWFRISSLIFAGILALQGAWLVAAEFTRPMLAYFPQDKASVERASAARSAAIAAATIGGLRGELWTDAAIALSSGLTSEFTGESVNPATTAPEHRARDVTLRATRLSPHDSRAWLLLAAMDSRFGWLDPAVAKLLKMSYLTGPNESALTPLRIRIATRSTAITDTELQIFVAQEIRSTILRHQDQKSLLAAAYREASGEGKQFIEVTVGDVDKNLLAAIRSSGGGR
jgi:hypothetical protein